MDSLARKLYIKATLKRKTIIVKSGIPASELYSTGVLYTGANGNTPLEQYSVDGVSDWHRPSEVGDKYIRWSRDNGYTWGNAVLLGGCPSKSEVLELLDTTEEKITLLNNSTAAFTTEQQTNLANQSGTNTGDETKSSILEKIGTTEEKVTILNNSTAAFTSDYEEEILGLNTTYQKITDNSLETVEKTIPGAINRINSIAKGATQAISKDNYQTLITFLLLQAVDTYNIGQSFLIGTVDVPDLWVFGINSSFVDYTYVSDDQLITDIKTNTYQQIGYYQIAFLESSKVDLSGYVPTSRTLNGYTLDQNITLVASDIAETSALKWLTSTLKTAYDTAVSWVTNFGASDITTITNDDYIAIKSGSTWYKLLFSNLKTVLSNTFAKLAGGNTFTGTQIIDTVQSANYQDLAGNTPFLVSNPSVFYYNIKAFTPAYSLTISADGTYVTAAGASFTAGTLMQQARLTVNGVNRVISSSVNLTTTVAYVTSAFPSSMWGQTYTADNWGIYSMEWLSSGVVNYISTSNTVYNVFFMYNCAPISYIDLNSNQWYVGGSGVIFNGLITTANGVMAYGANIAALKSTPLNSQSLIDIAIRRNTSGRYDLDSGVIYAYRDFMLRALKFNPIDITYMSIATTTGTKTSITVADAALFPSSGVVTIGSDTFTYTSITGSTPGAYVLNGSGTFASAHAIGVEVKLTTGTASYPSQPDSVFASTTHLYWQNHAGTTVQLV